MTNKVDLVTKDGFHSEIEISEVQFEKILKNECGIKFVGTGSVDADSNTASIDIFYSEDHKAVVAEWLVDEFQKHRYETEIIEDESYLKEFIKDRYVRNY